MLLEVARVRQRWPFRRGLELLKRTQESKLVALRDGSAVPADVLILQEHHPVFTLGRGADAANVLFDVEADRFAGSGKEDA